MLRVNLPISSRMIFGPKRRHSSAGNDFTNTAKRLRAL
jgi:hypothetical protein